MLITGFKTPCPFKRASHIYTKKWKAIKWRYVLTFKKTMPNQWLKKAIEFDDYTANKRNK